MTISKTLDQMLCKMEQSADENQAVAAACLRIDANRVAEEHACLRCEKAVWMASPMTAATSKMGQKSTQNKVFNWSMALGACGAFLPVTFEPQSEKGRFPETPYFCSGETQEEARGGFSSGAGERQGSGAGLTEGEFPLPRARGGE